MSLDTAEFYAFIINNEQKLKMEFREVTADMEQQRSFVFNPKKSIFHIPEQDFFKYDSTVKNETEYVKNAYMEYTSGFVSSVVRSTSEMLFEQYCEKRSDIEWLYKNGDKGQQYFFYCIYRWSTKSMVILCRLYCHEKDGTVWIIETKGGESKGINKNRDIQIQNKFNAFKIYAAEKRLNWGVCKRQG